MFRPECFRFFETRKRPENSFGMFVLQFFQIIVFYRIKQISFGEPFFCENPPFIIQSLKYLALNLIWCPEKRNDFKVPVETLKKMLVFLRERQLILRTKVDFFWLRRLEKFKYLPRLQHATFEATFVIQNMHAHTDTHTHTRTHT